MESKIKKLLNRLNFKDNYRKKINKELLKKHNNTCVVIENFNKDYTKVIFDFLIKTKPEVILFKNTIDYKFIVSFFAILNEKKISVSKINFDSIKETDFTTPNFKKELAHIVFENQVDVRKSVWIKDTNFLPLQTIINNIP